MNWVADAPFRVGDYTFGAIAEVHVSVRSSGGSMAENGEKHPLLVLLPHGEKVSGLAVNGHVF